MQSCKETKRIHKYSAIARQKYSQNQKYSENTKKFTYYLLNASLTTTKLDMKSQNREK